jgi:hypothetical protein
VVATPPAAVKSNGKHETVYGTPLPHETEQDDAHQVIESDRSNGEPFQPFGARQDRYVGGGTPEGELLESDCAQIAHVENEEEV